MRFRFASSLLAAVVITVAVAGCGQQQQQSTDVLVNSYKLTASNTAITTSFSGAVAAQNKVAVHARVSGHVIEKYVKGGEQVSAGQPLFKLDSRSYQAALASAQASVAQSSAAYQNSKRDLQRYATLANEDAIARQTLDTQQSTTEQNKAAVEANEAQVQIAQDNLNDTVVYAPFSGTLEMDDVDTGTYITAGSTALVTIDSTDPVFVEFSLSEAEYLNFMKNGGNQAQTNKEVQLKLADGTIYPYTGQIVQASKTLESSTGKMILKAQFQNPNNLLLPGMYATIISPGDVIPNAILVPTKAILQVLDKNFVMVIKDGKVEQVPITINGSSGIYTIVTKGVSAGDEIVVDGLTKVKNGVDVKATELTKEQLESNSSSDNTSSSK